MKRFVKVITMMLAIGFVVVTFSAQAMQAQEQKQEQAEVKEIKYQVFYFWAKWCPYCKEFDKTWDEAIAALPQEKAFVLKRADVDQIPRFLLKMMGLTAIPTLVVVNEKSEMIMGPVIPYMIKGKALEGPFPQDATEARMWNKTELVFFVSNKQLPKEILPEVSVPN